LEKPQYLQIIIRILLQILNGIFLYLAFENNFLITSVVLLLLLTFQIFLLISYLKNILTDIERSVDCLIHEDYSNTISPKKRKNPLLNKLHLLLKKSKKNSLQKTSEKLIFTNIIESLSIGILILRKDQNKLTEVFQINKAFTDFLKIPKYYNWELLQEKIPAFSGLISEWKETRHVISVKINDETEKFFFKTSVTQTYGYEYLIVSLETIQQLIDKKEKESWYKLMNVMSHEIINTITPISSLAENLDSLLQEENSDPETLNELSTGLKIIHRRSQHLNSFVDTYRKLAELPQPDLKKISLTNIIRNTLDLYSQQFDNKKIKLIFSSDSESFILADQQQIEQVLINLISNSLYALEQTENPEIQIRIIEEEKRTLLTLTDNGTGIDNDIKGNIFIPYFTTRKDGSGIGLTLAKSIMEAHGGMIHFNSKKGTTSFTLSFIK